MMYSWGTERRFNAYGDYFRQLYGSRVQKISVDAGFTCPNRDGHSGTGGCTFCNNAAFTPSYNTPELSVREQIERGMEFHRTRYRKARSFLAYFQSYSNTYGDLELLKSLYEEALLVPGIIGIVVGTRPDCVDAEKLDYFRELNKQCYLTLEYGIESLFDQTLERVNRGHNVAQSVWAVRETARRGIRCGGHLIVGLPGETHEDFLETARLIAHWPLNNIKFHQLQLIKGTDMAREYMENPEDFMSFSLEDYLQLMMVLLEELSPDMVVERIAGEVNPSMALKEGWGKRYDQVLKHFEELQQENDSWQGKKFLPES